MRSLRDKAAIESCMLSRLSRRAGRAGSWRTLRQRCRGHPRCGAVPGCSCATSRVIQRRERRLGAESRGKKSWSCSPTVTTHELILAPRTRPAPSTLLLINQQQGREKAHHVCSFPHRPVGQPRHPLHHHFGDSVCPRDLAQGPEHKIPVSPPLTSITLSQIPSDRRQGTNRNSRGTKTAESWFTCRGAKQVGPRDQPAACRGTSVTLKWIAYQRTHPRHRKHR